MNYQRRVIWLAAVLGVLLLTYIVGVLAIPHPGASAREPLVPGFRTEEIEAITIEGPSGQIDLERQGDSWSVILDGDRYPARDDRINVLLDSIASAQIVRSVTNRSEAYDDLGLGESGVDVTFSTGDVATHLRVGGSSTNYGGSYVVLEDREEVYAIDKELGFYFGQPYSYFAYLRMFPEDLYGSGIVALSVDVNLVEQPDVTRSYSYSLTFQESDGSETWLLNYDGGEVAADVSAVDSLLRATADLVGSGFYRDVDPLTLPVVGTVSFTVSDGREYRYEVRQGDGLFAMQGSGSGLQYVEGSRSPIWYEVTLPTLRRLFPEPDSLLPEETE